LNQALADVIAANRLEKLDDNLFRGYGTWGSGVRLYGGQVLSQAMSASQQTVPGPFVLHSMHAYFMRPGDPARAVIYDVDIIREGKSFVTRRVVARQHGAAIFSCQLSYQRTEQGFDHQKPMPEVAGPEGLPTDDELLSTALYDARMPPESRLSPGWPIEYRQLDPVDLVNPGRHSAETQIWFRAGHAVDGDLALHQQLLAFASDHNILITALRPHGVSFTSPGMQIATLDHAIWFHRPFRIDDWLLYVVESPSACNARGLGLGRVYDRSGVLVASVSQEGLIRQRPV